MASSLCPLPGGLLGGRPNELSSYSPPPRQGFSSFPPRQQSHRGQAEAPPPRSSWAGFFSLLFCELEPSPCPTVLAPGCLPRCPEGPAAPQHRAGAGAAGSADTGASREGGDAHNPPVARVKGGSSRSTAPLEAGSVHWTTESGLTLCWGPICPHPPYQDTFGVSVHPHVHASIHSPSYCEPGAGCWPKEMPTRAVLVRRRVPLATPKRSATWKSQL